MFRLITKTTCAVCTKAKNLLTANKYTYTEQVIGRDISREDVLEMFPGMMTVPIIVHEENGVKLFEGDYESLVTYLKTLKK